MSGPAELIGIVFTLPEIHPLLVKVANLLVPQVVFPHHVGAHLEHDGELQVGELDLLDGGDGERVEQVVDYKHHLDQEAEQTGGGGEEHVGGLISVFLQREVRQAEAEAGARSYNQYICHTIFGFTGRVLFGLTIDYVNISFKVYPEHPHPWHISIQYIN